MSGYIPPKTPEEQLLVRRVQELARAARYGRGPRFLGFLDERGRTLAEAQLHKEDVFAVFWGGFADARRWFLGLDGDAPPAAQDFPIAALCIRCLGVSGAGAPAHRDYLGALLGLGLKRTCVGDILSRPDGSAVCFVDARVAPAILQDLTGVGRYTASVAPADEADAASWQQAKQPVRVSVPSLRADAVVAALLHCSRTDAAALITRGAVSLSGVVLTGQHTQVSAGDSLSVRGAGHWQIGDTDGQSKKGRIWLTAERYTG